VRVDDAAARQVAQVGGEPGQPRGGVRQRPDAEPQRAVNPDVIVCLGGTAVKLLLGDDALILERRDSSSS
jgi:predicted transcriptional regulator